MSRQMTKLMPWVGGKAQLMWAIQMLLPTHYKTLVDVFGGSGIITMNTSVPSGCLQIYNDLNHDLYNLLFCAKERPLELVRELCILFPHSLITFRISDSSSYLTAIVTEVLVTTCNTFSNSFAFHSCYFGKYSDKKLAHRVDFSLWSKRFNIIVLDEY